MSHNRAMLGQGEIGQAVLRLDAWLDTMRGPNGYGGPVVHWWGDSLLYTGAGLDWRYEGIILGYLTLFKRTGGERWLVKARRAGDDLVQGQCSGGNFHNSGFELNPETGGTPHEAACDLALLHLALVLKERNDPAWSTYATTAQKNLRAFVIGSLWAGGRQVFRNTATDPAFVPNKAATIVEALFAWAALSGAEGLLDNFARPALEAILACQFRAPGDPLDGAIYQRVDGGRRSARFFPFYVARCVPALVQAHQTLGEDRFLGAARAAMSFILRCRLPDGSFPQVIYNNGRINRYPQWIAGVGDILRAMDLLASQGMDLDPEPTLRWLLGGRERSGTLRTARGFASQVSQRRPGPLPEFRDLLGVCGWADKAFRYLAGRVTEQELGNSEREEAGKERARFEAECEFRGQRLRFVEDGETLELRRKGVVCYRWRKGAPWAEVGPA